MPTGRAGVTLTAVVVGVVGLALLSSAGAAGSCAVPPCAGDDATQSAGTVTARAAANGSAQSADDTSTQSPYEGTPTELPGPIPAEYYDEGGPGVAYNLSTERNLTSAAAAGDDRDNGTLVVSDGASGHAIRLFSGEWVEYTVNVSTSGRYELRTNLSSPTENATVRLDVDGENRPGPLVVPDVDNGSATVAWGTVTLSAGTHVVRVDAVDGTLSLNWFSLRPAGANATAPPATRTPTPNRTHTASPTATVTSRETATRTATATPEQSPPTGSPTRTDRVTATPTRSDAPTGTDPEPQTREATSTATQSEPGSGTTIRNGTDAPAGAQTDTRTQTATQPSTTTTQAATTTQSRTETATQTDSPTATQTRTETATETHTDTETETQTQTDTETETETATQTETETQTETATQTDVPTDTGNPLGPAAAYDCPPASEIRSYVETGLEEMNATAVRARMDPAKIACLPDDLSRRLGIPVDDSGTPAPAGTDADAGSAAAAESTEGVLTTRAGNTPTAPDAAWARDRGLNEPAEQGGSGRTPRPDAPVDGDGTGATTGAETTTAAAAQGPPADSGAGDALASRAAPAQEPDPRANGDGRRTAVLTLVLLVWIVSGLALLSWSSDRGRPDPRAMAAAAVAVLPVSGDAAESAGSSPPDAAAPRAGQRGDGDLGFEFGEHRDGAAKGGSDGARGRTGDAAEPRRATGVGDDGFRSVLAFAESDPAPDVRRATEDLQASASAADADEQAETDVEGDSDAKAATDDEARTDAEGDADTGGFVFGTGADDDGERRRLTTDGGASTAAADDDGSQ